MDPNAQFRKERLDRIRTYNANSTLADSANAFMLETIKAGYSYNFDWLGRPIIQYPQDMVAMQELIWEVRPDLIIETGIAHGGSLIMSASLLAMLEYCDAAHNGSLLDPGRPERLVLGIDIDIRKHNRAAIESHPMSKRITLLQGSSVAEETVESIHEFCAGKKTVMVCLDSNHTHDHVLQEMELYAPLVTQGSYLIVFDGIIEHLPKDLSSSRPWGPGNNPLTAIKAFQERHDEFIIDERIEKKLLLSVAPSGFLKRVK